MAKDPDYEVDNNDSRSGSFHLSADQWGHYQRQRSAMTTHAAAINRTSSYKSANLSYHQSEANRFASQKTATSGQRKSPDSIGTDHGYSKRGMN
jgi:hypothetical protein